MRLRLFTTMGISVAYRLQLSLSARGLFLLKTGDSVNPKAARAYLARTK
jgi:hypothetical protein